LERIGGGRLWTIDIEAERQEATINRLTAMKLQHVAWEAYQGDSIVLLKEFPPHSVGFAWVDDDHTAQHVADELELLLQPNMPEKRIMAPNGIVAMHDVYGGLGLDGVCRRYHGLPLIFPRLGPAGGIGIIQTQ
jgi:hypothetical protein